MNSYLKRLEELDDQTSAATRLTACEAVAEGLKTLGLIMWIDGSLNASDRVEPKWSFGFGDDAVVGIATVAQIGGELARGAIDLLRRHNRYGAGALLRQLFEAEYLAHEFAAEPATASEWLRADGNQRRARWAPQKMRNRADGKFVDEHYWRHCELGGHPTTDAMLLLPCHSTWVGSAFLWVDLAGHLAQIWTYVIEAAAQVCGPISSTDWHLPDVESAIDAWHASDKLYAGLQSVHCSTRLSHPSVRGGPPRPSK